MEWARQNQTIATSTSNTVFGIEDISKTSRPFVCSFCQKAFKRRNHLNTHIKLHTGEKPFICQLCGKGYITKANLEYHLFSSKVHDAVSVESLKNTTD